MKRRGAPERSQGEVHVEVKNSETGKRNVVLISLSHSRADAVRAKLAELQVTEETVSEAVIWAREGKVNQRASDE